MGLGSYGFSTLRAIQEIAFRSLEKFASTQIVQTGLRVSSLLADYRASSPDKIPKSASFGLIDLNLDADDFELALHLVRTNEPSMSKIVRDAKGMPVLIAYLSVLVNSTELPPDHILESALPFAVESLSADGYVAERWNQMLQTEIARLAPLASTGLKFKGGKPKGAIGPLTTAVRNWLKAHPHENAAAIWSALSVEPPNGLTFCNNRAGKYVEYDKRTHIGNLKNTGYKRFANIVTSEVKRLKSLTV